VRRGAFSKRGGANYEAMQFWTICPAAGMSTNLPETQTGPFRILRASGSGTIQR